MLSILRFILVSFVASSHLADISGIGVLAVNFLFVISGYLITLTLQETYRFNAFDFLINRFLRLYPIHYAICLVALPIIFCASGASVYHGAWVRPTWSAWVANITIVPFAFYYGIFRISPLTWSVGVAICCYFLLWIFVSRSIWTAIASFVLAAIWQIYLFISGADTVSHYFPVGAALLPFSAGALSYFVAKKIDWQGGVSVSTAIALLGGVIFLFIVNWQLALKFDPTVFYGPMYFINTLLAAISAAILVRLQVLSRISAWCGDLSYPAFLSHWLGGFIAWHLVGGAIRGWQIFLVGYAISIVISILCVILIDRPIQKLRRKIKRQQTPPDQEFLPKLDAL